MKVFIIVLLLLFLMTICNYIVKEPFINRTTTLRGTKNKYSISSIKNKLHRHANKHFLTRVKDVKTLFAKHLKPFM